MWKIIVLLSVIFALLLSIGFYLDYNLKSAVAFSVITIAGLVSVLAMLTAGIYNNLGRPVMLDKLKKQVWYVVEGVMDLKDRHDGFVQVVIVRNSETTKSIKYCIAVKLTEKLPESFIKSGFYVNPHYASSSDILSLVSVQQDKKEIIVMPISRPEKD